MSKVDDELTRRLRRAERPVDGDAVFEGLARRRSHRERVRRVQGGVLAFAVLAATAAGFLGLRAAFTRAPLGPAIDSNVSPNGRIVFSRVGGDGHYHLFVARPDGTDVEQLTHGATDDTDPAFSPDGRWITVVRIGSDGAEQVETVSFDRPDGPAREPQFSSMSPQPAWSADGSMIAVREGNSQEPSGTALLIVPFDGDSHVAHLAGPGADLAHPSWSPDSRIVFALLGSEDNGETGWDLATVSSDGGGFRWLLREAGDQTAPAWSPDGSRIAYLRQGDRGSEIWTMAPDGTDKTLIATAIATSLQQDLAWTPDGTAVLVSDGEWINHVDASPDGDPTVNFLQVVRGISPSSQPIPPGAVQPSPEPSPSPSSEPSLSPSPASGLDVGLAFPLCDVEALGSIDWYGDGTSGTAWTGARATQDGRCPEESTGEYVVAADLDGDGEAEPGGMGFLDHCLLCRPFGTMDLNADGVLEVVVLEEASSTPAFSIYEVSLPTSERSPGIYALFVAAPGYPAGGFPGNEPIRFLAGGDEGFSAAIDCEGYPEAPVLVVAWSNYVVEVDDTEDVYLTRLRLGQDGAFHVIDSEHFSQDVGDPLPIDPAGKACGIDFNPLA